MGFGATKKSPPNADRWVQRQCNCLEFDFGPTCKRIDHAQTGTKSSVVPNNEILSKVFLYNSLVKPRPGNFSDTVRKNIL